jgi:hypothetical protein
VAFILEAERPDDWPWSAAFRSARGQDVLVGAWGHDRDLLLLFVEGIDQLDTEVVFPS